MRDQCQSTDIAESEVDLVVSKNVNVDDISWRNVTKMQIDSARSNFTNPISKATNYDNIVVILETRKPGAEYKYPISRPIYRSKSTDLSTMSLKVCLKQNEGSQLVADDTIQLDDSVLMRELNQEYKKIMQIGELFNSPNRIIKLNENNKSNNQIVQEDKFSKPHKEDNIGNEILKHMEQEDKDNVEVSDTIIPLPVTVNMEHVHQKIFNAASAVFPERQSSPEPKKAKLSSSYNCTVTSGILEPNQSDRQSMLIYPKLPLNVDENLTITSTTALMPDFPTTFFTVPKIQVPKSPTHTDDICASTTTTLTTNVAASEHPERKRKDFFSNINNCASTSIVTVQDSITNCLDSQWSNLTEYDECTTTSSSSIFIFPKVNKLPRLSSLDDSLISNSTVCASTIVSAFPKVYPTHLSSNKNCTITSSMTDVTEYSALTLDNNNDYTSTAAALPVKNSVINNLNSESLKTLDNCTSILNELSEELHIQIRKFRKKYFDDAKTNLQIRNVDPPSTFSQPRAVKDSKKEKTVKNSPVRNEFIIYDTFNDQFKPGNSKGVKRSHPKDCSNYKKSKIAKKATFEEPLLKEEIKSEGHSNWELYNYSRPQDCFEAVRKQWGYGSLPNPHQDLTCRFYDSLPKYNTNFTITGATANTIECFSIYESQLKEIDQEINAIKLNLDNCGSSLAKREINKHMQRWNYLKSMRNRLYDALDDAKRFYRYYKDNQTNWDARHISEYHINEVKQVLDMLNSYNDFYGYP